MVNSISVVDLRQIDMRVVMPMGDQSFSSIYGMKKADIVKAVGEDDSLRLTLDFMKAYPGTARINGLRKVKARYMVTALLEGVAESGNHFITCYGHFFHFFYRGTLIYKWDAVKDERSEVHANAYEDTASTRNQRKEIAKAIDNFRESVLTL